jgi:hypothetical protein
MQSTLVVHSLLIIHIIFKFKQLVMKKTLAFLFAVVTVATGIKAQSTSRQAAYSTAFESAMQWNIRQLDTASSEATLVNLANNFERIGNAEKTRWQPFYYAAYCYTVLAFMSPDKSKIDPLADKAETILQQGEALEKNNSEISCLFAVINSCRIMVDPVGRFQVKGKEVQAQLAKARQENADNPRIYLQQARMQIRMPEGLGGGKKAARESAEIAVQKFKDFKPENSIAPTWGEQQAKSLLEKLNAQ